MKIVDLGEIIRRQRRTIGRFREFDELFFVVNIGQRRSHTIVGEQPKQRGLAERALGIFKEAEFLDLFDSVEQPTAWTMAAVIGESSPDQADKEAAEALFQAAKNKDKDADTKSENK